MAALATLIPGALLAHPGGLDSRGGHNDRKNGGYHYHRQASTPAPASTPSTLHSVQGGSVRYQTFDQMPSYLQVKALRQALINKGLISEADLEYVVRQMASGE